MAKNARDVLARAVMKLDGCDEPLSDQYRKNVLTDADALLAALDAAGLVVVPKVPTGSMIKAADAGVDDAYVAQCYRAMLAAYQHYAQTDTMSTTGTRKPPAGVLFCVPNRRPPPPL